MNVAFIVENKGTRKFTITNDLNFGSTLCVYNVRSHQITWVLLKETDNEMSNLALRLFDLGVNKIVATHLEDFQIQELNQNEMRVYQSYGTDLIDNIKRYNKNYLREMEGEILMVPSQFLRRNTYAEI